MVFYPLDIYNTMKFTTAFGVLSEQKNWHNGHKRFEQI